MNDDSEPQQAGTARRPDWRDRVLAGLWCRHSAHTTVAGLELPTSALSEEEAVRIFETVSGLPRVEEEEYGQEPEKEQGSRMMTRSKTLPIFIAGVLLALVGVPVFSAQSAVETPSTLARDSRPSAGGAAAQTGASVPARCAECHHSDQVSQVVQLTTDPSSDLRPAWSPDSTQLAYYSGRSGNDDIWVVNMDGTNELQVTEDSASDRRPAWSPDGTKLVYDSDRAGSRDIWISNADGSDPRQLTNTSGEELFASWSPAGSDIVFFAYAEGHNEIWAVSPDGTDLRPLTDNLADEQQGQCTFACHQPSWSPDGARLAFHADADGKRDVWIMDADGGNRRQLTSGTVNNYLPSFTSDGKIIFISEIASLQKTLVDIKMLDPDGGEETTLFEQVAHGGPFIWSPDGNRVALHSQRAAAGNFDIFIATLGDAPQIEVPAVIEEIAPDEPVEEAAPEEAVDQESEPSTAPEVPLDEPAEPGEAASPAPARVPLRLASVVALAAGLVFLVALVAGAVVLFVVRSRR